MAAAAPGLAALEAEIAAHLDDSRRGERLREGFCIAIVGAPNAGKSSLLNRLAGREAAIVSTRAGTNPRRGRSPHGPRRLAYYPRRYRRPAREPRRDRERRGCAARSTVLRAPTSRWWSSTARSGPRPMRRASRCSAGDALAVLNKTDLLPDPSPAAIAGHPALGGLLPYRRRHRGAVGEAGGRDRAALPGGRGASSHEGNGTGTRWWNAATRSRAPLRGPPTRGWRRSSGSRRTRSAASPAGSTWRPCSTSSSATSASASRRFTGGRAWPIGCAVSTSRAGRRPGGRPWAARVSMSS